MWRTLAVFAFLLTVPLVSAQTEAQDLCVITIRPNDTFGEVVIRVDEIYNETHKADLAEELDADGDAYISPEEARAYEEASIVVMDSPDAAALGVKRLFLDDKQPVRVVFQKDLSNVVGPANETDAWLVTEVRSYEFEPEALRTHRIQGGNESHPEPRAIVEFVVVEAPGGWWVHRVNDTLYDETQVTLPSFDTRRLFQIDFSVEPGLDYALPPLGDSRPLIGDPGFEFWIAMLATGAAVVVVSRIRR